MTSNQESQEAHWCLHPLALLQWLLCSSVVGMQRLRYYKERLQLIVIEFLGSQRNMSALSAFLQIVSDRMRGAEPVGNCQSLGEDC